MHHVSPATLTSAVLSAMAFLGCMTPLPPQSISDVTGYVIHIEGNMVMTDLGHPTGIEPGDMLVVFDVENTVRHPVTDELVQVRLTPVATVRVDTVGDISSTGTVITGAKHIDVEQFVRVSGEDVDVMDSWWEEATTWSESQAVVTANESLLGQDNQALEIQGVGDCACAPFTETLRFHDALTVEAWVRTSDSNGIIAGQHVNGVTGNWVLGPFGDGSLQFGTSAGPKPSSVAINDDTWHHIAGVIDLHTNTGFHFVDGVLVLTFSTAGPLYTRPVSLFMGCEEGQHAPLSGHIDELRVWNRALSQEEIRANMGISFRAPVRGLVAHYTFDKLDPQGRVPDISGNGNHATLKGNASLVSSSAPVTLRRNYMRGFRRAQ